jgi:hypothetical protein
VVSGQLHATAALPGRKESPLPTEYKAGLVQGLFELFEEEKYMLLLSRTENSCFGYPVSSLVNLPIAPFQSMNSVF